MKAPRTRREFLAQVASGALLATVGPALVGRWDFAPAEGDDPSDRLSFGALEPLVAFMQETPLGELLPGLVAKWKAGTSVKALVAAGALANARTFGGEDYVGFHTMMALSPAYRMALESPEPVRLLPVLKVLYRNTARIQEFGGASKEVLRGVEPSTPREGRSVEEALLDTVRAKDVNGAERTFAALASAAPDRALGAVLRAVEDETEVHRVALAYRSWDLLDVVGAEHAHLLLRQSIRYCAAKDTKAEGGTRGALARSLEAHGLPGRTPGSARRDDAWIEATCAALLEATADQAADLAGAVLAEGTAPAAVFEAISLAANQLLLRDAGRSAEYARPGKPVGSVHGDSIGLHASDAVNAWRNLARAGGPQHAFACGILGAYQVARDRVAHGVAGLLKPQPLPLPEDVARVAPTDAEALLREADAAIRAGDQARGCAVVQRYGDLGHPAPAVLGLMLRHATSQDGALHAEKYFRTASEEFAATGPRFRWRHLVSLARVTASEYGHPAPGFDEAVKLLGA